METVQGGVPPYGVKEALVVNGKMVNVQILFQFLYSGKLLTHLSGEQQTYPEP